MKRIIYITSFFLFFTAFMTENALAQAVFNDTILFKITKTRPTSNGAKYLIEYQTEISSVNSFSGKMVLSMCSCYCDSIWDAWPKTPSDSIMTGGAAVLTHYSTSGGNNNPGALGIDGPGRFRGRLGIWQMPGSFSLTEAFMLPVTFTKE